MICGLSAQGNLERTAKTCAKRHCPFSVPSNDLRVRANPPRLPNMQHCTNRACAQIQVSQFFALAHAAPCCLAMRAKVHPDLWRILHFRGFPILPLFLTGGPRQITRGRIPSCVERIALQGHWRSPQRAHNRSHRSHQSRRSP